MAERPMEIRLNREDFPSNKREEKGEKPEKKVQKVAQAKVKKKGAVENAKTKLFGRDFRTILRYLTEDILIPSTKNLIWGLGTGWLEMSLYGEIKNRRARLDDRFERGRFTNYDRRFEDDRSRRDRRRDDDRKRARLDFDDITFDTREEACDVLDHLVDLIADFGSASVHDFYDLAGIDADWTDDKYGWTNLRSAYVDYSKRGYFIILPRARVLD